LALKVDHSKPFRSQIVSPEFEVNANSHVIAKVSYLIADPTPNHSVWAEISVHRAGDTSAGVRQGYFEKSATFKKLSSYEFYTPTATRIQVTLQGNNLYNDASIAIYFDNIEIWVNGKHATQCKYAKDGLKFN
jgi:hypothetical protein